MRLQIFVSLILMAVGVGMLLLTMIVRQETPGYLLTTYAQLDHGKRSV